jgi:hypothetical protein
VRVGFVEASGELFMILGADLRFRLKISINSRKPGGRARENS